MPIPNVKLKITVACGTEHSKVLNSELVEFKPVSTPLITYDLKTQFTQRSDCPYTLKLTKFEAIDPITDDSVLAAVSLSAD